MPTYDPAVAEAPEAGIRVPLSVLQEQMWAFKAWALSPGFYNDTITHRFSSRVDEEALRLALAHVLQRHEPLRTGFPLADGRPYQSIAPDAYPELVVTDLGSLWADEAAAELARIAQVANDQAFDPEEPPLMRAQLVHLPTKESVVVLTFDHLVADEASLSIVVGELRVAYKAFAAKSEPVLPPLEIQYADFAVWQRSWLTDERLRSECDYWVRRLARFPGQVELPYDRPPEAGTVAELGLTVRPAVHEFNFPESTYGSVAALAAATRTTVFMICLATVNAVLARLTGQLDRAALTTYSGRYRSELEPVVGLFAGVAVLRTDLAGDDLPFSVLLDRTRATVLECLDCQHVPVMRVVEALHEAGEELPLDEIPITVEYFRAAPDHWSPGTAVIATPPAEDGLREEAVQGTSKPLALQFLDDGQRLWLRVKYHPDCFDYASVQRLVEDLRCVLAVASDRPETRFSQLPVLPRPS